MRKAKTTINVELSRIGVPSVEVDIDVNSTIKDVILSAGWNVSTSEKVYVDGLPASLEDELELTDDGARIQIASNKEGGLL